MSLKEFDWKNFLLMKGERIALGLCVITTLVLVVMSLFLPGHGFFDRSEPPRIEILKEPATKKTETTGNTAMNNLASQLGRLGAGGGRGGAGAAGGGRFGAGMLNMANSRMNRSFSNLGTATGDASAK